MKKFSPERLLKIRRLRKARRLFKTTPLFAYTQMKAIYPDYTYEEFLDDLRPRRIRKAKKKKSSLARFGRYLRIEQLKSQFRLTRNYECIIKAEQLRRNITKPYRVMVKLKENCMEYTFSPLIPIGRIEQLVISLNSCKSEQEVDQAVNQFSETTRVC
jgi:hypothetical protein